MQDLFSNPGFVALMGTLFGGAGLKIVEHQLGRAKAKAADAQTMRDELRKQIDDLNKKLERADAEEQRLQGLIDEWKEKYWTQKEATQKEILQLSTELAALKGELERLKKASGGL